MCAISNTRSCVFVQSIENGLHEYDEQAMNHPQQDQTALQLAFALEVRFYLQLTEQHITTYVGKQVPLK